MKTKVRFLLSSIAILLGGCATIPPLDFTVQNVGAVSNRKDAQMSSLTVGYAPQNQQDVVKSNHVVPPLWKEAMQDAINRSLLFRDESTRRVNVSVRITTFDPPSMGLDMVTKAAAISEVIDRSTGDLLFTEKITSEGVVPMSYAFVGAVRMQESANRAVRNNIADFIKKLEQTDISKPVFKGPEAKK